jgi:lysozyme
VDEAMMKPSQRCVEAIKYFEGFRANPYTCPGGKSTVGYGHVLTQADSGKNYPMSEVVGEYVLKEDLRKRSIDLIHCISTTVVLETYQFDALLSFLYNVGIAVLRRSTLLKRVNEGRHIDAAEEFQRYIYAGRPKVVLPGLIFRRRIEAKMYAGQLERIEAEDLAEYLERERGVYEEAMV